MKILRATGTLLVSSLALAACGMTPGFESSVRSGIETEVDRLANASSAQTRGGARDADRPYLGATRVSRPFMGFQEDHGRAFPAHLEADDAIELNIPTPVGMSELEVILEELTGINISIRTRYTAGGEPIVFPIDSMVRLNYSGSLSELVEWLATDFDMGWHYDGRQLTFDRLVMHSYEVPVPPASGDIGADLSGVNVGGNSVTSSRAIQIDPWAEIETAINAIAGQPSQVTFARNLGRIDVLAPPSAQRQISRALSDYAALYSQRIAVEVATFFVDASRTAELGVDFNVAELPSGATGLSRGVVNALQGGIGVVASDRLNASLDLRNLNSTGIVADFQSSNTVTQNGVVAPIVLTNSRDYVSSIRTGGTDQGSEVETETINSGISVYSLPRLMRNGQIHLSVWVTQSELNRLDTFDTGNGIVQLPDADQRAMEYTLVLDPGETLIMGGYEQDRANSDREGGWSGFGGSRSREGSTERTRMVIMVRPSIVRN